ncbi:hypothetical protein PtrSN002B_007232 [Pyrenophora tritici-repentis]|uniref:Uncharacterized protein n=3 Tax=Pyrenophora tritici-repentis TaxID=45151 RepID=A0A2W1DRW0_9PLEO|nr:uncharacterized protein PTRG_04682 [Pyrenophora tritici-repentis Pt-1C-BFP]KAA8612554.1 hypothetical protein PtrV1_13123 [Pyrenophora tritici-repentis]EDU47589.1 predicted protein [Pyrenophora tritici-repentis Pt-1C-BFP]KAF7446912.1 hypothetical protein A1F99_083590 [Pyrenophora tritici-repentis]KAF7569194.1 hypothetical protein PtrM4_116090 [Pyrenophora tritici-repentis]KAG9383018.1 hypothetical protein A1F94_006939 [Pyrenophora tritici-repentis]
MPTYFARGITARLAAMPLEDTTTSNIILRKGEAARQQAEASKAKFLQSKLLAEKPVPFPGDENKLQLNWLGGAPFMQVRAGKDLFAKGSDATTETTQPIDLMPLALILHLHLSDKSFVSGLQDQKTSLKIDVFFNGQLSGCRFIPVHDLRSGVQGLHQTFSGTRIDFLAERPWIFVPPESTAVGTVRKNDDSDNTSTEERWRQLCQALQNEACERGTNEAGEIPPTAHFLSALATMHPPDQVYEMQQLGKKKFGTIDIIVTAGEGRKITDGVGYLKAPQRMVDTNYPFEPTSDSGAESQHKPESVPKVVHLHVDEHVVELSEELRSKAKGPMPSVSPHAHGDLQRMSTRATNGAQELSSPGIGKVYKQVPDEQDAYRDRRHRVQWPGVNPTSLIQDRPFNTFAPQLHLSPHSMQPSDAAVEGAMSSGMKSHMTPPFNVGLSSPLEHFPLSSHNLDRRTHTPLSTVSTGANQVLFSSSPYTVPYFLPKRPTAHSLNADFPALSYSVPPMMPGYRDPDGIEVSATNPRSWNHSQPSMMQDPRVPLAPPSLFHRRPSGALPPVGLYSVPTKPKRSLSPQKKSDSKRTKNVGSQISISRLEVKGRNGTVLIDRRWTPAKILSTTSSGPHNHDDRTSTTVTTGKNSGLTEHDPRPMECSRSTEKPVYLDCPAPTLGGCNAVPPSTITEVKEKHRSLRAGNSSKPFAVTSTPTEADTDSTEKAGSSEADVAESGSLLTTHPTECVEGTSETCPASETRIMGVQGPKANPFWLEDPEIMLREASAQRRARQQTRQSNVQPAAPTPMPIGSVKPDSAMSGSVNTSPLSSLHTTPDIDMQTKAHTDPTKKAPSRSTNPLPEKQCDRQRELRPTRSHTMQDPSTAKLNTTSQSRVGNPAQTPAKSASNRKPQPNITKQPRSPKRLQTNDNPAVNQDCVIAFAESKVKTSTQGVLRQIKGERSGVFTEEYVVSAMRFFVEA